MVQKIYRKRPKLPILGLNPHNAELRHQSEEKTYYSCNKKFKEI